MNASPQRLTGREHDPETICQVENLDGLGRALAQQKPYRRGKTAYWDEFYCEWKDAAGVLQVNIAFDNFQERIDWIRLNLHKFRDKNPACFCPLEKECHGDVLLELANREPS